MVILTGKAFRTIDKQKYVFFVLFFCLRPKKSVCIIVSVSAKKKKLIFQSRYLAAENRKFNFSQHLVVTIPVHPDCS